MTADSRASQDSTSAFEMTENMPVGMFVTEMLPDGTRQFVFVSNRLLHMLGLDRRDVMRDWRAIYANIHPDDFAAFLKPSEESWNGVTVFRWEGRVDVRGEERWFLAESNPRPRPGGGAFWDGVIFDVTDRKQAEREAEAARSRELSAALDKLTDLERAMKCSLMAGAVAHDVKQPLAAALFYAEKLLERFRDEPLVTEARILVDNLTTEARHVADSVERMRGLLKSVETIREPFDLVHICQSAARVGQSRAARQGVRVEVVVPQNPVMLVGDAAQIQVAILNLLTNGVDAVAETEGDHGIVRLELHVGKRGIECVVGDSGPGYDPNRVRMAVPNATKQGGTGMGLHIVRSVVGNHRGRLDIGRSPLGGAEFRIVLPRDASLAEER